MILFFGFLLVILSFFVFWQPLFFIKEKKISYDSTKNHQKQALQKYRLDELEADLLAKKISQEDFESLSKKLAKK